MADTTKMAGVYIEDEKTPFTFEAASEAMRWALSGELNCSESAVPDTVLALALAKTALETGRWTSIHRYNWGNIKAGLKYEGMYTCFTLNEVLPRNGKNVTIWFSPEGELGASPSAGGRLIGPPIPAPEGHVQTRMRAYANQFDGAQQYCEFVHGGRYKNAWGALLKGDPKAYVHELKVAGYFTADESTYLKGVASIHKEFLGKLRNQPVPEAKIDWDAIQREARVLLYTYQDMLDEQLREEKRAQLLNT